jgi:hypothetical protein
MVEERERHPISPLLCPPPHPTLTHMYAGGYGVDGKTDFTNQKRGWGVERAGWA